MQLRAYIMAFVLFLFTPLLASAIVNYSVDVEKDFAQLLSISDAAQVNLDLNGDFTVEAWIKPETIEFNQPMDIVSKFGAGDPGYSFSISGTPGALQVVFVDAAGNASQFETDPVITTPGEWRHVAVVTDVSVPSARFYLDGEEVPVTLVPYNAATSINDSAAPFRIGTRGGDTFYFDGLIDEVRVWDTTRSQKQIQKSMLGIVKGNLNRLVGNWTFDTQTFQDSSEYGNHLIPVTAGPAIEFSTETP